MSNDVSPPRWYRGADVPMRVIRRFVRQVAEHFKPDKIILFGSHASGAPHADSDVDIFVIMAARNELDQALKIRLTVDYDFPLDLVVRTPKNVAWRMAQGDSFVKQVISTGRVLYAKPHPRVGAKGRGGLPRCAKTRTKPAPDA